MIARSFLKAEQTGKPPRNATNSRTHAQADRHPPHTHAQHALLMNNNIGISELDSRAAA
jgi:hypothetical protein